MSADMAVPIAASSPTMPPGDLLALVRGHWTVEHTHWLRDVVWDEDQSLLRTVNVP
jgi:predicted transposase YbfD/YdcC